MELGADSRFSALSYKLWSLSNGDIPSPLARAFSPKTNTFGPTYMFNHVNHSCTVTACYIPGNDLQQ